MSEEGDPVSEDSECDIALAYHTVVDVSPDSRFERFEEELSHSAYKHVYRCYDTESGRQVAWHSVSVSKLSNGEIEGLCKEIKVFEGLKHPNIVFVIAAWYSREKSEVVLITEVVSGGPLTAYLRKIKTPVRKVVRQWCREILEALVYLHSRGVIHRDLKIENIHIDSNTGNARLCNLGLSSLLKSSNTEYLAPEVYDQEYSPSADIYGLGMSVLEMCTHSQPYSECSNSAAIYHRILSGVKPKCLSRIKDSEVKSFISSCLASAQDRPSAPILLKHAFLQQQENEMECMVVPLSSDDESTKTIPIKLKILHKNKTHKVRFEYIPGDLPEDLAQQVVAELGLEKVFIESIVSEIKSQVLSNERDVRHPHVIIVKPSSFTVVSPAPHNPSMQSLGDFATARMGQTTSLIDMDEYIESHHIPVSFTMIGSDSPVRIEFDYSITFDRPDSVARELVHELNLPSESISTIANQIRQAVANSHEKRHKDCQTPDLERNLYYKIEDHSTMAEVLLQDLSFEKVCSPFATGTISPIETKAPEKQKALHDDFTIMPNTFSPKLVKSFSEKGSKSQMFERDLHFGDEGENVKALQETLNKVSATKLKVNGMFDMQTWLKVVNFQEEQALAIDGIIRKPTWDKLIAQSHFAESQHRRLAREADWNKIEFYP
mmetsp:Transcript_484/g.612  ORF Transcript_484/g.612 Transcript_484/m.612 type:complete len:661 (-) Transcript_484:3910-5892(-)|eukprot:CAMPEP_0204910926 /NCGR_PEP_ID=MMETSP1397-20131031/9364_1 /ASSEMBLY_ACC=CAM_ASM_000891 /TAXON_ID=49980 /ORGANISM="Climacostomum Climacostomum virens, Strain Stock W-24" /LENGTH=660 /DNA_ID=CAMNT_0052081281 /DNA_START=939 /DNA_END=2921 /DNA_ORIENTATION=+